MIKCIGKDEKFIFATQIKMKQSVENKSSQRK